MSGESTGGDDMSSVQPEHARDDDNEDEVGGHLYLTPEQLESGQTPSQLREAEVARRAAAHERKRGDQQG